MHYMKLWQRPVSLTREFFTVLYYCLTESSFENKE